MKAIVTILFCLVSITGYGQSTRILTDKMVCEAPLPSIWQEVKYIYVWDDQNYSEYEIKKAPLSRNLNKNPNDIIMCNYIFDVEGNKTSCFILHLYEFAFTETVLQGWNEPDSLLDVYRVVLLQEIVDEAGEPNVRTVGKAEGLDLQHAKFAYYTGEKEDTFFGEREVIKYFKIRFNREKTKAFLHSVSLIDALNQ